MNFAQKIQGIIDPISKGTDKFEMKLISWPYSRNFIQAVLTKAGIEYTYKRLGKLHETFTFKASDNADANIRLALREINKACKDAKPFASKRNELVSELVMNLTGEVIYEKVYGKEQKTKDKKQKEVVQKEEKVEITCPSCGSSNHTKNGKDSKGRQKHKCKDCGHNFVSS